ncbi:tetratricopeptide repeat-containing diguanylate cyclase [Undibacterium fentianense]|uniref:diguanylate cyclase n=1 Tax=Undibacterium fentianense TaxID=2828728 RepID=A0A941IDW9_9BURK|nr:tetratricopeptide repeat-containing diguanylate cyclase [Undibacterium fentianense]MBR7801769.1 GGDEF domain-containing protein [Undibacterium fentianense]
MACQRTKNLHSLVFAFFLAVSPLSVADLKSDQARLEAIQLLSEKDNQAALKQLKEFYSELPPNSEYQLRLDVLRELSAAYFDAGDIAESDKINLEILNLARARQDKETVAVMQIDDAFKLRDAGKYEPAIAKLNEVAASLKGSTRADNLLRLESAYAMIYRAFSKFEQALSHQLEALRLTDQLTQRKTLAKIRRLDALASLYLLMQNPEQTLLVANEALVLASQVDSPKIIAGLRMNQAMALCDLKRYPECLVAYERSLNAAQEANLPKLEALILSNIADLHLRTLSFTRAEMVARQALKKAELIQDLPSIYNAKANVGFALGGQGKIAQAMEFLNPVLDRARDLGDKADLEAVVGEIGRMYEHAKMYKEALQYTREQQKIANELFRADRSKTVAALQEQFDADQRKKQIELLARENQIKDADIKNSRLQQIITLLGAVLTIMGGIFIYMLYRKVKQTNERLEEVNQQLEYHSVRDPLTGLHNRRSFLDLMKVRSENVEHDRREDDGESPDCLMIMDIDHFKHINDSWGHSAGDAVLVEVAKRLRSAVRDSDMTLRWGGEEFLIYAPKTKPEMLMPLVDRVMKSIGSTPVIVGNNAIPVTISAGYISLPFSGVPEEACNWEKAMQLADMALYMGKVNGRNRAYGLLRLLAPYEQALPELERDFSDAIRQGLVEVAIIQGPATSQ